MKGIDYEFPNKKKQTCLPARQVPNKSQFSISKFFKTLKLGNCNLNF